jgi:hypothetical protein
MRLAVSLLIIAALVAVSVIALLLVRRRAPEEGFFSDGDRAAGVFGVLATGFALLLGFVVFLAFESFDQSRSGAEQEAVVVGQQFETAQFMPPRAAPALSGEIVCYARYVVHVEWPQLVEGTGEDRISPWTAAMFHTLKATEPVTASQQAAFGKWLDQTSDREEGRLDRVHGAEGVLPGPLWVVLIVIGIVIVIYMLFFADRSEHAAVQAMLIGSVVAVFCLTLLVIRMLDQPFRDGPGSLKPVAMERTLRLLEQATAVAGRSEQPPCDARGLPLKSS